MEETAQSGKTEIITEKIRGLEDRCNELNRSSSRRKMEEIEEKK